MTTTVAVAVAVTVPVSVPVPVPAPAPAPAHVYCRDTPGSDVMTDAIDDTVRMQAHLMSRMAKAMLGPGQEPGDLELEGMDRFLNRLDAKGEELDPHTNIIAGCGAWFGEQLREAHDGRWLEDDEAGLRLELGTPPRMTVHPCACVYDRANDDSQPTLSELAQQIATAMDRAEGGEPPVVFISRHASAAANHALRESQAKFEKKRAAMGERMQKLKKAAAATGLHEKQSLTDDMGGPIEAAMRIKRPDTWTLDDGRGTTREIDGGVELTGTVTFDLQPSSEDWDEPRYRVIFALDVDGETFDVVRIVPGHWLFPKADAKIEDVYLKDGQLPPAARRVPASPVITCNHDWRDTFTYTTMGGEERSIRVKYLAAIYQVVPLPLYYEVRLCYFEAGETGGYRTICYRRGWHDLLVSEPVIEHTKSEV